jgi:hypothetical protein
MKTAPSHHSSTTIANAAKALSIAADALRAAASVSDANHDWPHWFLDGDGFLEMAAQARIYARLLADTTSAAPSLDRRVFRAIATHTNLSPRNIPHTESALMALKLAYRCLCAITSPCEVVFAVRAAVRVLVSTLDTASVDFGLGRVLNTILPDEPCSGLCRHLATPAIKRATADMA